MNAGEQDHAAVIQKPQRASTAYEIYLAEQFAFEKAKGTRDCNVTCFTSIWRQSQREGFLKLSEGDRGVLDLLASASKVRASHALRQ